MFWNITYAHHYAMDWTVFLQNSYVKVLILKEDGPFRRLLRLNEVIKVGPQSDKIGGLLRRGRPLSFFFLSPPLSRHVKEPRKGHGEHNKKADFSKPGRESSITFCCKRNAAPDHAGSLTSNFQCPELWENNFFCLSHSVYGILLWQPK